MGFEPTVPCGTPDFESGTFGHSATLPRCFYCTTGIHEHRISARPAPKFMYGWRGMKFILFFFLVPCLAWANDAPCFAMKDSNNRNYCLGIKKRQESYCNKIDKNSLQFLCLAELTKQKSYCDQIKLVDDADKCKKLFRFK